MAMTVTEARSFVKQVALMTRGHDEDDNTDIKGGAGRIGMTVDGKVFKFNTHLGERWGGPSKSQDMINSCNRLRDKLLEASQTILLCDDKGAPNSANNNSGSLGNHLDNIRKMLGIKCSENGMSVLKASTERLLDRTVTAKVLNILVDESPSANVNALWTDVKQGYIKTYTDSKFTVMEDRVTRHVKGISDEPLSVFMNQPEMKDEDIRFPSLVSQCFEKFKLACRRKIENTLAGKSTDMIKFHDDLAGRLNGIFDDLIKKQFSGDYTKTKLLAPMISAAKAEIDSATRQVGQIQYGKILTKDLFDGRTHSVLGDQKLANAIEMVLKGDRINTNKSIESLVSLIVNDLKRGHKLTINGNEVPPSAMLKDPNQTRKDIENEVKNQLVKLCTDPNTGKFDEKSLAAMSTLMRQDMVAIMPFRQTAVDGMSNKNNVVMPDNGCLLKLRMGSSISPHPTTEITSGTLGEWNVKVKFVAECESMEDPSDSTFHFTSKINGQKNKIDFETSVTFKSGVIGNSSSDDNPKIIVDPDRTRLSMKLIAPCDEHEAMNAYAKYLDEHIEGKQPAFVDMFKAFNHELDRENKLKMSEGQFKTWIKANRDELFNAIKESANMFKYFAIVDYGKIDGYPMFPLESKSGSHFERAFTEVRHHIEERQRICSDVKKTVEKMFEGQYRSYQMDKQEVWDFLSSLDSSFRQIQEKGGKLPSSGYLEKFFTDNGAAIDKYIAAEVNPLMTPAEKSANAVVKAALDYFKANPKSVDARHALEDVLTLQIFNNRHGVGAWKDMEIGNEITLQVSRQIAKGAVDSLLTSKGKIKENHILFSNYADKYNYGKILLEYKNDVKADFINKKGKFNEYGFHSDSFRHFKGNVKCAHKYHTLNHKEFSDVPESGDKTLNVDNQKRAFAEQVAKIVPDMHMRRFVSLFVDPASGLYQISDNLAMPAYREDFGFPTAIGVPAEDFEDSREFLHDYKGYKGNFKDKAGESYYARLIHSYSEYMDLSATDDEFVISHRYENGVFSDVKILNNCQYLNVDGDRINLVSCPMDFVIRIPKNQVLSDENPIPKYSVEMTGPKHLVVDSDNNVQYL